MLININDRQHALILASLRYFQNGLDGTVSEEKALESRAAIIPEILDGEPPTLDSFDELCEAINGGDALIANPEVCARVSGGVLQGAQSNVPGLAFDVQDDDNLTDDDHERDEDDPEGTGALDDDECDARWAQLTEGMKAVY
jgi:hypothetical protein